MSTMVVSGEPFTDEGIPMRRVHHRGFTEIRGGGETVEQGVIRPTFAEFFLGSVTRTLLGSIPMPIFCTH